MSHRAPPAPTAPTATTTRSIICIWMLAAAILLAALGATVPGHTRARREAHAAIATLSDTTRHAERITSLTAVTTHPPAVDPASAGLTPRVTTALQQAGLPTNVLANLSPEAETVVAQHANMRIVRRRATLALSGVTLPQVGKFLDAWRSAQAAWRPVSIDLSPLPASPSDAGKDLPLRVAIAIEMIRLHDNEVQP